MNLPPHAPCNCPSTFSALPYDAPLGKTGYLPFYGRLSAAMGAAPLFWKTLQFYTIGYSDFCQLIFIFSPRKDFLRTVFQAIYRSLAAQSSFAPQEHNMPPARNPPPGRKAGAAKLRKKQDSPAQYGKIQCFKQLKGSPGHDTIKRNFCRR